MGNGKSATEHDVDNEWQIFEKSEIVIVNICGATSSGKSTLADRLAQEMNSPILPISQDHFFREDLPLFLWKNYKWRNYECRQSVDFDKFRNLIEETITLLKGLRNRKMVSSLQDLGYIDWNPSFDVNKTRIVDVDGQSVPLLFIFIEGFLSCSEQSILNDLVDVNIFLNAPKQACMERRCKRDQQVDFSEAPPSFIDWFSELVWPFYLCYRTMQVRNVISCNKPFLVLDVLDGQEQPRSDLCENVQKFIGNLDYKCLKTKCDTQQFVTQLPEWYDLKQCELYVTMELEEEKRLFSHHL